MLLAAPSVVCAQTTSGVERLRDALDLEDTESALEQLPEVVGDPSGLACVEALLRERRLSEAWRPRALQDNASRELRTADQRRVDAALEDLQVELSELSHAYTTCLDAPASAPPGEPQRGAYAARHDVLVELLARLPSAGAEVFDELSEPAEVDTDFDAIRELLDASPGVPPPPPERAPMPGWRWTPLLASALTIMIPMVALGSLARMGQSTGKVQLALLGVSLSGLVGLTISGSWLRSGPGFVWAGGLLTAGMLAVGAVSLIVADRPKWRVFGVATLAGGVLDLAWWLGGLVLRWRDRQAHQEWLRRIQPMLATTRAGAVLGLRGAF